MNVKKIVSYIFLGCLLIIFLIFIGSIIFSHKANKSDSIHQDKVIKSQSYTNTKAVLAPATVPPKVYECNQPISFNSDGSSGPISCPNGDINVTEWNALAALEPKILTLGYNASENQIEETLCSDVRANISNPIEKVNYQIASLYYGWQFNNDPTNVLGSAGCTNQDD